MLFFHGVVFFFGFLKGQTPYLYGFLCFFVFCKENKFFFL